MPVLTAAGLLAAWEHARSLPVVQRPAALVRAFGLSDNDSVGTRDAALLSIYAENFSSRLDGLARCPQCGVDVELSVPVAELTAGIPAPQPIEPLHAAGVILHWRLPDDDDLVAVASCPDPDQGALLLLSRCVVRTDAAATEAATPDEQPAEHGLPAQVRAELAERIAAADPYADISFGLVCPDCDARWDSALEIGEFVWAQLSCRARMLLREVDALARAYGWAEDQILALSQDRRDSYLELVRHG